MRPAPLEPLTGDYTPPAGSAFDIITTFGGGTTPGVLGSFSNTQFPPLPGSLAWNVEYGMNFVRLAVLLPGDYNDDGVVDAADYTVW